ncbi:MAG: NfeD family protein, partial [Alphaproteobacteria bacterium]|nr:NfeD family protein [Alphaproteobacteria bacterium]
LGLAMIATGVVVWLTPLVFPWSILMFCALSIVFVLIGRRIYGSVSVSGDQPFLNRRADALVGRSFTLAAPIKGGEGEIVINDTHWKIRGPDMPAGTRIKITGIENATVLVAEQV